MGVLYIIGNGFDLHFGLKTRTDDFKNFLRNQTICNEMDDALTIMNFYGVDWNDYEDSLKYMDLDEIESRNEVCPDYYSDHESDRDFGIWNMSTYLDGLHDAIFNALIQMVDNANDELKKKASARVLFQSGDAILNFNYTSTVEYLFSIPKDVPILHIHGCRMEEKPLVFGYKHCEGNYTEKWISTDADNGDYYIEQQRETVYMFYSSWKKEFKLQELNDFLLRENGINEVIVLGHSMGDVDSIYMETIERRLRPFRWRISYYKQDDQNKIRAQNYSFEKKIEFSPIGVLLKE